MWAESGRASVAAIAVLQTWLLVLHFYLVKPAMPCPGNLPFHDWLIQAGNAAAVFQQDDEMSSIRNVVIDVMTDYQRQQQQQQAQPANMQQAMPMQPPAPPSLGQHVLPPPQPAPGPSNMLLFQPKQPAMPPPQPAMPPPMPHAMLHEQKQQHQLELHQLQLEHDSALEELKVELASKDT